jgi:hypothetical protein
MKWRDHLPVHQAADLFPKMSGEDLDALAEDIKQRGLVTDIVVWKNGGGISLFDGRNRLDALDRIGFLRWSKSNERLQCRMPPNWDFRDLRYTYADTTQDPYDLALSLNVHRRHLTGEQKREVIAKVLAARPERSNRQIGKQVGASPHTVGSVRAELESTGQIAQLKKTTGADGKDRPAHKPASEQLKLPEDVDRKYKPPVSPGRKQDWRMVDDGYDLYVSGRKAGHIVREGDLWRVFRSKTGQLSTAMNLSRAKATAVSLVDETLAAVDAEVTPKGSAPAPAAPAPEQSAKDESPWPVPSKKPEEIIEIASRVRREITRNDVVVLCDWSIALAQRMIAADRTRGAR